MIELLEEIVTHVLEERPDASDIQFVGGGEAWVHENGKDVRLDDFDVENADILAWAEAIAPDRGGSTRLANDPTGTVEKAAHVAGTRLRMTWRRQFGGYALNTRIIPSEVPALDSPRYAANPIPDALTRIILENTDGLVLFEGPTGSGKSTMQASLINEVNETQQRHIYTLEDPIEFIHQSQCSLLTQREIGTDTSSFHQGMMTAKRSKPGIILLGELRDPVTMRAALEAAESGHLVMATAHSSAVPEAITTFIGTFPSDEQNEVSQRLSVALRAVIVQKLVPAVNGRVVAVREMLTVDSALASKIRDGATGPDLRAALQSTAMADTEGTFSRDDDLIRLVQAGHVSREIALQHSIAPKDAALKLQRVQTPATTSRAA